MSIRSLIASRASRVVRSSHGRFLASAISQAPRFQHAASPLLTRLGAVTRPFCSKPDGSDVTGIDSGTPSSTLTDVTRPFCSKPDGSDVTGIDGTPSSTLTDVTRPFCSKPDGSDVTGIDLGTPSSTLTDVTRPFCSKPDGSDVTGIDLGTPSSTLTDVTRPFCSKPDGSDVTGIDLGTPSSTLTDVEREIIELIRKGREERLRNMQPLEKQGEDISSLDFKPFSSDCSVSRSEVQTGSTNQKATESNNSGLDEGDLLPKAETATSP